MKRYLLLLGGLLASYAVLAAPQKVTAVYEATRDGKPFATVNEIYRQEGNHYRIESTTTGTGVYALFGKRRLVSEGEVTAEGLKPLHFEQQQGDDAKKKVTADFDWAASKLAMTSRKKTTTADLAPGTQDLASFGYQFMFRPPTGDGIDMQVTTGKRLRNYHYQVSKTDEMLPALAGSKLVRLSNSTKEEGDDEKEFWLAVDKHYLPARIVLHDDSGATIEQVLTSLSLE